MIGFIVPLKSKQVSLDWISFSGIVERTLRSITNQSSDEYFVAVICHERPEITFQHPKIFYHVVDFDAPKEEKENYSGKRSDKAKKLLEALTIPEIIAADYIMPVDSDDLISNEIASFVAVNKNRGIPGWYFSKGFIYKEGSKSMWLNTKNFNALCGTCIVIKPELMPLFIDTEPYLNFIHRRTVLNNGVELEQFPFPGVIYSIDNGHNFYMNRNGIRKIIVKGYGFLPKLKNIIRKILKYRIFLVSNRIKKEFNL
jgi:hypothetical protein